MSREIEKPGVAAALDNIPVRMVRLHLRDLPQAPFPEGFAVRPMQNDEGSLWEDIWRDAEPF
jgi:hypothetical protein